MARKIKNKFPGSGAAKVRLTILLMMCIIGIMVSFMTLPEFIEKVGADRAIPEAFASCAILFLLGDFFWGMIKWVGWMGKKSFAAASWFLTNWPIFTITGFVVRLFIAPLIVVVPPLLFGFLFIPLYWLTWTLGQSSIHILIAVPLFLGSSILTLGLLIWDICFLARRR